MFACGKKISATKQIRIRLGMVFADLFDDVFDANHRAMARISECFAIARKRDYNKTGGARLESRAPPINNYLDYDVAVNRLARRRPSWLLPLYVSALL